MQLEFKMSTLKKHTILTDTQIKHIIQRLAYQIYEEHINEKEIVIVGVFEKGSILSKKIISVLENISPLKITYSDIYLNKKNPSSPIKTTIPLENCKEKSVVIIDDVLNSGKTLMYAIKYFLEIPISKLTTAVLINRNHKKFPVKAKFKGLSLSTSLKEHITVNFEGDKIEAFLS